MIVVNWSELPVDLLVRIVENHLTSVDDFIIFSSVCRSWNRATHVCNKLMLKQNWLSRQMPWLILTDGNDDEYYSDTGSYRYHMYENNVMGLHGDYEDEDNIDVVREIQSDGEVQSVEDELTVDLRYCLDNDGDDIRTLFNLSLKHSKGYSLRLPQLYGKACWGSRYGWIVTLGLDRRMHLFNPLTKAQLPLPSQTTFPYPWSRARDTTIRVMFFSKVVLLRVPHEDHHEDDSRSWLVVALHRCYSLVAIARPGDSSWTHLKWHEGPYSFMDVIYCTRSKLLIFVDGFGDLFSYDVHHSKQSHDLKEYLNGVDVNDGLPNVGEVEPFPYLVQYADSLLLIVRNISHLRGRSYEKAENFRVFRLCSSTTSWEEVDHLGDVALFLGGGQTRCIDASNGGCKRNCIYFCEQDRAKFRHNQDKVGGHDMGVFNLTNKTIEPIYEGDHRLSSYCTPFWFSPSIF